MKGATLQELGVIPSFSRLSVSNDNPYFESILRTLKYRPEYLEKPFADLSTSRHWVNGFIEWYNDKHYHSGIKFVTLTQCHKGEDVEILFKRKQVYEKAKAKNPNRWSRETRNWELIRGVHLNSEKCKSAIKEIRAA